MKRFKIKITLYMTWNQNRVKNHHYLQSPSKL